MKDSKVQLKHPESKKMPAIAKEKYEVVRKTMLSVLKDRELSHNELIDEMKKKLTGKFEGSIPWYSEGVKLDLEAQKLIMRTDSKPQKYKLK